MSRRLIVTDAAGLTGRDSSTYRSRSGRLVSDNVVAATLERSDQKIITAKEVLRDSGAAPDDLKLWMTRRSTCR